MLLNRTLFAAFVALLAFSPLLSVILSDLAGPALNDFAFIWVGVGFSLPLSLVGARAFGEAAYSDYWAYLESSPGSTKADVLIGWTSLTVITLVVGIIGLAT